MADKKSNNEPKRNIEKPDAHPPGGLSQEESGGPGSDAKRRNQERDGQRQQGLENDQEAEPRETDPDR